MDILLECCQWTLNAADKANYRWVICVISGALGCALSPPLLELLESLGWELEQLLLSWLCSEHVLDQRPPQILYYLNCLAVPLVCLKHLILPANRLFQACCCTYQKSQTFLYSSQPTCLALAHNNSTEELRTRMTLVNNYMWGDCNEWSSCRGILYWQDKQRQAFTMAISEKTRTPSDGLSQCGWLTLALSRLCCKISTWHKCSKYLLLGAFWFSFTTWT